jgi:hypothetical protein
MTDVVCIEFCCQKYKTVEACLDWVKTSGYSALLRLKAFKLRKNKHALFLTDEKKRPVFRYNVNQHKYQRLDLERFPGIIIVVGDPEAGEFNSADVPEMLPENFAAQEEKRRLKEERAEKVRQAREKLKEIRKQQKEERARSGVKDTTRKSKKKTKKEKEEEAFGIKLEPVNPQCNGC